MHDHSMYVAIISYHYCNLLGSAPGCISCAACPVCNLNLKDMLNYHISAKHAKVVIDRPNCWWCQPYYTGTNCAVFSCCSVSVISVSNSVFWVLSLGFPSLWTANFVTSCWRVWLSPVISASCLGICLFTRLPYSWGRSLVHIVLL